MTRVRTSFFLAALAAFTILGCSAGDAGTLGNPEGDTSGGDTGVADVSHDTPTPDSTTDTEIDSGVDSTTDSVTDTRDGGHDADAAETCSSPKTVCGTDCTDVTTDPRNCGSCGFICGPGFSCAASKCVCSSPHTLCGPYCVDTTSDPAFCGSCVTNCGLDATGKPKICVASACKLDCAAPTLDCGDTTCTDVTKDPTNCGACGKTCGASEDCVASACVCKTGLTSCGGTCTDTTSDPSNCGTCGKVCTTGFKCSASACTSICPSGTVDCSGSCVDTTSDPANCGACGTKCATGLVCNSSVCGCPTGLTSCGGVCVDTTKDGSNCGACGTVCPVATTCTSSACKCNLAGTSLCGGVCVDEKSDPGHCGSCTGTCPSGSCVGGACTPVAQACKLTGPYQVLFYGPNGSGESAYLPTNGGAAVVTTWDEATWKTKTTTDFKAFDLIVVGEGGVCPPATNYQTLFDTMTEWSAAVSGHVVVTEQDPVFHAGTGKAGAGVWLKAVLQWAVSGPGTGLYVAADCGNRGLDFMHQFSSVFHSIGGSGDTVTILDTAHPIMAGSTSASLSTWGSSFHGIIDTLPSAPPWETVANGTITSPAPITTVRNSACPLETTVTFPSSTSTTFNTSTTGTLGTGGGGGFFIAGSYVQQSFPRATNVTRLDLNFRMSDLTSGCAVGKDNTFDVKVNGVKVGSYDFVSTSPAADRTIIVGYSFAPIAPVAGAFTIQLVATSTVCPGGSSWNWYPGGTATMQ